MRPRTRPNIVGLEWDERNERHIAEHLDPWLIDEMIEGGDWFAFRNYQGHPPEHRLFIGRTPAGQFVSAVLREPTDDPGIWRPITGWFSTAFERERYRAVRQRQGRHRG